MISYDSLRGSDDFCICITWNGIEDKPFPRIRLVSAARAPLVVPDPLWSDMAITAAEYNDIIATIADAEFPLLEGEYPGGEDGYSIQIEIDATAAYCFIGSGQQAINLLLKMAETLHPEHQQPVRLIVNRLQAMNSKSRRK